MSLFEEVNTAALARLRSLLKEWLPAGRMNGREFECGDIHGHPGKSFKVNIDTGRWADFAGAEKGGDVVSLYAAIFGLEQAKAAHTLGQTLGVEDASNGNRQSADTQRSKGKHSAPPSKPMTLEEFAAAKQLPIQWLSEQGLDNFPDSSGVAIGYYDENENQHPRLRQRTALRAKDGSIWLGPKDIPPIAYGVWRLADARKSGDLILVEGETDALSIWFHSLNLAALGLPGASMAKTLEAKYLDGIKRIFIHREPDRAGGSFVSGVASRLCELEFAGAVKEFSIPGFKDPSELHIADPDRFRERFDRALDTAVPIKKSDSGGKPQGDSQATRLVNLAQAAKADLFHDSEDSFATIRAGDHVETYALKSRAMRHWLTRLYFEAESKAPNAEAIRCAIDTLAAYARFNSEERKTHIRVAAHNGRLYLDLANARWQIVEITPDGWRLVEAQDCPVRFRRAHGMLPLPAPVSGGSINDLRKFLNVQTDDDFRLIVAYLLSCYRDRGPYPVLIFHGEQGSAKSTHARILRDLIDPNVAPIRSEPREPRDLMIAANNGWLCAFDNLSRLHSWLSDALCRLSTGGGFSTRELYTDSGETIFDSQRPIILNGIEELAERGDLLDRAIIQYLPRIDDKKRLPEATFYKRFRAARPRILGALLDAVSCALRRLDNVNLERLPRMADFATWVVAAEPATGWDPGAFIRAYAENREAATELTLEASPIAAAIRTLGDFAGSATELLVRLGGLVNEKTSALKTWPKTGRALSNDLRRLTPGLGAIGIDVTFEKPSRKTGGRRLIRITPQPASTGISSSPSSPSSPSQQNQALFGDDSGDDGDARRDLPTPPATPKTSMNSRDGDDGDDGDAKLPSLAGDRTEYEDGGDHSAPADCDESPEPDIGFSDETF